jgi:hypothetical protein
MRQRWLCLVLSLAGVLSAGAGSGIAAAPRRLQVSSPPYRVTVSLEFTSPFVPDGRMSLAELSFRVSFTPVFFEFDPAGDPLLGRCQINAHAGKGSFTKIVHNDVQEGNERQKATFLSPRPKEFSAQLDIESEPTEEDEAAAKSRIPPEKVRLTFWTELGLKEVEWGSRLGTNVLPNFKIVFEAPFRDLLSGKPLSVTLPYEGTFAEDKGTWKIEFIPETKKE